MSRPDREMVITSMDPDDTLAAALSSPRIDTSTALSLLAGHTDKIGSVSPMPSLNNAMSILTLEPTLAPSPIAAEAVAVQKMPDGPAKELQWRVLEVLQEKALSHAREEAAAVL